MGNNIAKPLQKDELRVTHVLSEVKTATWEIHDILALIALDRSPNPSIEFEAGHSIFDHPVKLRMEIANKVSSDEYLFSLKLVDPAGTDVRNIGVKYHVSTKITDQPGTLFTESATPKNFVNWNNTLYMMRISSQNVRRCLVQDALTVELKLTLFGKTFVNSGDGGSSGSSLPSYRKRKMVEESRQELLLNFGTLLDTGFNSDFKIKVRKLDSNEFAELKVHKSILGARSDVLKAMLESPMQEQATGTMTIEDLSEDCVKLVMKWIYSGSLDDDWEKVPEEMVRAADKYHLTLLLDYLNHNLHLACELDNAVILLNVAKLHGLAEAVKNVTEFIRANFDKVLEDVVHGNLQLN